MSRVSSLTIGNASQFEQGDLPIFGNRLGNVGRDEIKQAQESLRALGKKLHPLAKVSVQLDAAAQKSGLAQSRAFDIWYGKARRVTTEELEHINAATRKVERRGIRNDIAEIRAQLAVLEARLDAGDADFHEPVIGALRDQNGSRR